jgi:hypothetical protein
VGRIDTEKREFFARSIIKSTKIFLTCAIFLRDVVLFFDRKQNFLCIYGLMESTMSRYVFYNTNDIYPENAARLKIPP